jgi:hypothetical protein
MTMFHGKTSFSSKQEPKYQKRSGAVLKMGNGNGGIEKTAPYPNFTPLKKCFQ